MNESPTNYVIKESGAMSVLRDKLFSGIKGMGSVIVPIAIGNIIAAGGAHMINQQVQKKRYEESEATKAHDLGEFLRRNPHYNNNPIAKQRFAEIASISPAVAATTVADRIVKRTLKSGLDDQDMYRLITIEARQKTLKEDRYVDSPQAAAFRQTAQMLTTTLALPQPGMGGPSFSAQPPGKSTEWDFSPENVITVFNTLKKYNALPTELKGASFYTKSDHERLRDYIASKGPNIINELISKHSGVAQELRSTLNTGGGATKTAELLGDIYSIAKYVDLRDAASLEKTAGVPAGVSFLSLPKSKFLSALKEAILPLTGMAMIGGAGAAIEQAVDYKRSIMANRAIAESFLQTMNTLKAKSKAGSKWTGEIDYTTAEYQKKAKEAFQILADIAPSLASNSSIAAPFVNRVVQNEGEIDPTIIKTLTESQRNINTTKEYRSPFADSPGAVGLERGFRVAGGAELIKGLSQNIAKGLAKGLST